MKRAELMKKLIFILLFISLTCSVCETFEVRSAQSFYQVFKNDDVTLEWTFTKSSLDSLYFSCFVFTDDNPPYVLLHYIKGDELPPSGLFEGRVQLDKDVLRERRIRLHVSSLRTEDSGRYSCEVGTSEGSGWASCSVNVTDKLQTTPETTTEETKTETEPEPEGRNTWTGMWICLSVGLSALVLVCGFIFLCFCKRTIAPFNSFRQKSEGKSAGSVKNEAGKNYMSVAQTGGTHQTEVSAVRETADNVNDHESSSSNHSDEFHSMENVSDCVSAPTQSSPRC